MVKFLQLETPKELIWFPYLNHDHDVPSQPSMVASTPSLPAADSVLDNKVARCQSSMLTYLVDPLSDGVLVSLHSAKGGMGGMGVMG